MLKFFTSKTNIDKKKKSKKSKKNVSDSEKVRKKSIILEKAKKDFQEWKRKNKSSSYFKKMVICEKLSKMCLDYDDGGVMQLDKILSDPKSMRNTFLDPSFLKDYYKENMKDEDFFDNETMTVIDSDMGLSVIKKDGYKFPVKLVIGEISDKGGVKNFRRATSPLLQKIPKFKNEFGLFHSALIIGPWYLEWTDSSLCIPRTLASRMAILTTDIDTNALVDKTHVEISKIISKLVCKWNVEMTYCNFGTVEEKEKEKKRNCQDFVDELMKVLGLSLDSKGALKKYFKKLRNKGICDAIFEPTKEYRKKFRLKSKSYKFETHAELDEFVNKLIDRDCEAFQMDFKDCRKLLKSFDRAFWLRHIKNLNDKVKKPDTEIDERYKPKYSGLKVDCPFEDPRETRSFIVRK